MPSKSNEVHIYAETGGCWFSFTRAAWARCVSAMNAGSEDFLPHGRQLAGQPSVVRGNRYDDNG